MPGLRSWKRSCARAGALLALVAGLAATPRPALAICNVIPGANERFRGALGSLDRPFATPGEIVRVTLDPGGCDPLGGGGFVDQPGGTVPEDDYAVTIVFSPPSGRRNAVVVARDCAAFALKVAACDAQLGAGIAACVPAGADGIHVEGASALSFRFPDTTGFPGAGAGNPYTGPAAVAVTRTLDALPCQLGAPNQRCVAVSNGTVACVDDLFPTANGACSENAVDPTFGSFTALPAFNDFQAMLTSAPGALPVRFAIDRAGNALVPMDWQRVLVRVNGTPYPRLVSGFTTIAAFAGLADGIRIPGLDVLSAWAPNGIRVSPLFTPISNNGLFDALFGTVDAPLGITRVSRRLPILNRCTNAANLKGAPCLTQEQCGGGEQCLPLPAPEYQVCNGGGNVGLPCLLAEDCPGGTCEAIATCRTGPQPGLFCKTDGECGGECGPQLFDFAGRMTPDMGATPLVGVGPVIIGGAPGTGTGTYTVTSLGVTTLEGQRVTPRLMALVQPERLANADLNGDGDAVDPVVELLDRNTTQLLALGYGQTGDAVTRVTRPPLRATALDAEDDVAAWLEPEAFQGDPFYDANDDGDALDHMVRVGGPGLQYNTLFFENDPADPTPVLNDRSLVVSDGLVFFRTQELDTAARTTEIVSVDSDGNQGFVASGSATISGDGRNVAFSSRSDLAPGGVLGEDHVYLRDRCRSGALAVPGCFPQTELVDVNVNAEVANGPSDDPRVSRDGRFVLFESSATNLDLVQGDANGGTDLFVRDRCIANGFFVFGCIPHTTRVTSTPAGGPLFGLFPTTPVFSFSPGGRFFVFESPANGIVPGDADNENDLFLVDRDVDRDSVYDEPGTYAIERVNLDASGAPVELSPIGAVEALRETVSDDGRFVAFSGSDGNLYVRDRCRSFGIVVLGCAPGLELASVPPPGVPAVPVQGPWAISSDGRRTAFGSGRVSAGGPSYLRDRVAGGTARFDVATPDDDGTGPATHSYDVTLSGNGRFVSFLAPEPHLVPFDTNGELDAFVHDVLTGITERTSLAWNGSESAGGVPRATWPMISEDGLSVVFTSQATNLTSGLDANGLVADVFVRSYQGNAGYGDLTGDGLLRDHVLRVYDARIPFSGVLTLGPAREAAVSNGNAAFLRESDSMAMWWPDRSGAAPQVLGRRGDAVRATPTLIALLASEIRNDSNYNGGGFSDDTDQLDWVVQVAPTSAPGAWTNTGQASTPGLSFDAKNDYVAFLGNEQTQGTKGTDFTGDGDVADDVPRLWSRATGALVDLRTQSGALRPARNLVLGDEVLAYRVRETDVCKGNLVGAGPTCVPSGCSLSTCDLNGDGDCCDDLLFGKDLGMNGPSLSSGRNVVDCALPACDPRTPYRVEGATVRFLEPELGRDLNGNPDRNELLVRVWNLRTGAVDTLGAVDPNAPGTAGFAPFGDPLADDPGLVPGAHGIVIGGYGRCVAPRAGSSCTPATGLGCKTGEFCDAGLCKREYGTCRLLSDCPSASGMQCLPDKIVVSVADSDGDSQLDPFDPAPTAPDPRLGSCATEPDLDEDGLRGACDNCPTVYNPGQKDTGGVGAGSGPDGIGDDCQCGDVNGDGRVTLADSVLITRSLLLPPTASLKRPELCSTDGSRECSIADAVVIRRALLSPPTASIARNCR